MKPNLGYPVSGIKSKEIELLNQYFIRPENCQHHVSLSNEETGQGLLISVSLLGIQRNPTRSPILETCHIKLYEKNGARVKQQ